MVESRRIPRLGLRPDDSLRRLPSAPRRWPPASLAGPFRPRGASNFTYDKATSWTRHRDGHGPSRVDRSTRREVGRLWSLRPNPCTSTLARPPPPRVVGVLVG